MFLKCKHVESAIYLITVAVLNICGGVEYDSTRENDQLVFNNAVRNTIAPRNEGGVRFEDDTTENFNKLNKYTTRAPGQSFKFQDDDLAEDNLRVGSQEANGIAFQDHTTVNIKEDLKFENHKVKKKRRRKRKPRLINSQGLQQLYPGVALPGTGHVNPYPGYGLLGGPTGQYYRPPRRAKPSLAFNALVAVTGALSSIALHDDYQCVPRLLCEAAGGGSLGPSNVLQSISNMQPLLTLLSVYNGISSSPLFIFGRAVFLGMTSKGNTAACRYAYPQCPTDPEQLVHYLNNHNGGFFRYFNSPPSQSPQNVQQFYNQLSNPNPHGFQSSEIEPNLQFQNQYQNHYMDSGFQQPFPYPQNNPYGFQSSGIEPNLQLQNQHQNHNMDSGFQQPFPYPQNNPYGYGFHLNLRPNSQGFYGLYNNPELSQFSQTKQYKDHYNQFAHYAPYAPQSSSNGLNFNKYRQQSKYRLNGNITKNTKNIQRRIQNKPYDYNDEDIEDHPNIYRLIFSHSKRDKETIENTRTDKALKFPDHDKNTGDHDIRHPSRVINNFIFPESTIKEKNVLNEHHGYLQNEKQAQFYKKLGSVYSKLNDYDYYNNYGNAITKLEDETNYNDSNANNEEDLQTVYIVRGNGDPNNPEIIKIRPGDKVN